MSFTVASNITIGAFTGVKLSDVTVKKSIHNLTDTATLTLPSRVRIVKLSDSDVQDNLKTAYQFKNGDQVNIRCGYVGSLNDEFTGFLTRINYSRPVVIECEGYSYQLRNKQYTRSWRNTTLKEVLDYLVTGTDITLHPDIPYVPIDIWLINNANGVQVLERLKEQMFLTIFFTGKVLYAGLAYTSYKETVKYRLGWNCPQDGLKLREAPTAAVKIVVKGEKLDGTNIEATAGAATGENIEFSTKLVSNKGVLQMMAEIKLKEQTYTGFEGNIPAFAMPYCEPGYKAAIENPTYPDLNGSYLVVSTDMQYGSGGARRNVGIGIKVS